MVGEIRIGRVSAVDYKQGLVSVAYMDRDGSVTKPLPMLSAEYKMPKVGELVMVLHLSNGAEAGLVLGGYWHSDNLPTDSGEHLFCKELGEAPGEALIRYDGKTLTIKCTGSVKIEAGGNISLSGATINLN